MKTKLICLILIPLLMLTNGCKRIINEEIKPQITGNPNVVVFDKPIISDRTIIVNQDAQIKSFTDHKIVFGSFKGLRAVRDLNRGGRMADFDIEEIKEGAILVAYSVNGAVDGFLVKVTAVAKEGTDIVVEYVNAKLDELFKDIHFKFTLPDSRSIPIKPPVIKIEDAKDELGRTTFAEIELSGLWREDYETVFEYQSIDYQTVLLSCLTTKVATSQLSIKENLGVSVEKKPKKRFLFAKTVGLGTISLPFLVQIGPIPIRLIITVEPLIRIDGNVKTLSLDFKLIDKRLENISGNIYRNGQWEEVDRLISNKDEPPSISSVAVEGELKASINAAINVALFNQNKNHKLGDEFSGITTEIGYFGKLTGFCDTQKGLGVKATTGWDGKVYTKFELATKELTWEYPFKITETPRFGPIIINDFCSDEAVSSDPIVNEKNELVTSASDGDPHLRTFDRASYSLMSVGEFTAVKSTSDNFEVQARQEEVKTLNSSGTVSWNTGLAIRTGNSDVCIYPPDRVFVNRQSIGFNFTEYRLTNGGKIEKNGNSIRVITPNEDEIKVNLHKVNLDYYITPNENRKGKVRGILGNYDESATNDLQIQDGTFITGKYEELYPRYADSWRIKQNESIFVYDSGKNTESYTDRNFPRNPVVLTAAQRNAARTVCEKAGVTDPILLENCIVDVASANDNTLADRIYETQINTRVLKNFAIGGFSASDVQLRYSGSRATNREALLDTRLGVPSVVLMKQGVYIKKGFATEFSFSTAELQPTSCFFLAIWPTDTKFRSDSQNRVGFCFGIENNKPITFFTTESITLAKTQTINFADGKNHKVKIFETQLPNRKWRVQLFLDNMIVPQYSVDNDSSIAEMIDAQDNVGYIELQINEGVPSSVKIFNWSYSAL